MEQAEVVYKLIHFKPFEGYEILGEYETQEEAETMRAELQIMAPKEWLEIARVPRVNAASYEP